MPPDPHPERNGTWLTPVATRIPAELIEDLNGNRILDDRDLFVLHAVMLNTGRCLWFSGHTESAHYATVSYVFDPTDGRLRRAEFPRGVDLFCCHYAQMADGRILAVGGSEPFHKPDRPNDLSSGSRSICVFDPVTERWTDTHERLHQGRWYPTLVVLSDGRILVFSGRREESGLGSAAGGVADAVELITPPSFRSEVVGIDGTNQVLPIYPGLHVSPAGRVFFTRTNWGLELDIPDGTVAFELTRPTATTPGSPRGRWHTFDAASARARHPRREEGMSVLLPPAREGRILVIGGSIAEGEPAAGIWRPAAQIGGPSRVRRLADPADPLQAEILRTAGAGAPEWTSVGPMARGRTNGHCVLLPDATVLICGGHDGYRWNTPTGAPGTGHGPRTRPSRISELYVPGTGAGSGFRPIAAMTHPRRYHSAALLLADGRVVIAGGADPDGGGEPPPDYSTSTPGVWRGARHGGLPALNRKDYEIYEPRYLHNGPRPSIVDVRKVGGGLGSGKQIRYDEQFRVLTHDAAIIRTVVLVRPGAVTHHTDSEQRYVPLDFTAGADELLVRAPPLAEAHAAPPGYYMLWIVDGNTVDGEPRPRPCMLAPFLQLHGTAPPPRPKESSWCPCIVATVALGSPAAPGVVYLQTLRDELGAATRVGTGFVTLVNGAYYRVSPPLARWLAAHHVARAAVRDVMVRPTIAAVAAADGMTQTVERTGVRTALLVLLLALLGIAGLALLPLWALLAALVGALRGEVDDAV